VKQREEGEPFIETVGQARPRARIRRILVPVDFSPCSLAALDQALGLAESHFSGAELDVLHVWEPKREPNDPPISSNALTGATIARPLYAHEEGMLDEWLLATERRGHVRVKRLHEHGEPVPTILAVATRGYDLIVMGTRGRSDVPRSYLGRVAEKVARGARCPVLTVGAEVAAT
jgi:nucleotide-binding universal stress UspA family protein